jgi:hypothetical protein
MINPVTQRFMARRMGARIRAEKVDHTPLVTAPEIVIELILDAVASLTTRLALSQEAPNEQG